MPSTLTFDSDATGYFRTRIREDQGKKAINQTGSLPGATCGPAGTG